MSRRPHRTLLILTSVFAVAALSAWGVLPAGSADNDGREVEERDHADRELQPQKVDGGKVRTFIAEGRIDRKNPFFADMGTNGRTCATCHDSAAGWSVTPAGLRQRFEESDGLDPIFALNDGAVSPKAAVGTVEERRAAFAMLLSKGLIRVGLGIPDDAEFTLDKADDPYGYASAAELSLFRRPLASANLRFNTTVMWDGRETVEAVHGSEFRAFLVLRADLMHQANDATLGHAQAEKPLTPRQQREIADFELSRYTAQHVDDAAGKLYADGARGGPARLSRQRFHVGINDPFGGDPGGAPFDPAAFDIFDAWASAPADDKKSGRDRDRDKAPEISEAVLAARASVARGQAIFNTRQFDIAGVPGLTDAPGRATLRGTCTTCHNAPNVGTHSADVPMNIGISGLRGRTPDLPIYTLRNKPTGETTQSSDPGRALVTGKWADVGKFKVPGLRGLAARAPYFHNGRAATLADVVNFYNGRFSIGLTDAEKADLAAFLRCL